MNNLVLLKLCSVCNEEFELQYVERHEDYLITNMENCPHCKSRNDTWLKIANKIEPDDILK